MTLKHETSTFDLHIRAWKAKLELPNKEFWPLISKLRPLNPNRQPQSSKHGLLKPLIAIGESEIASVQRFCELLQVEREPIYAYDNPEIPVLLLNGGYDPVTPQIYGETVARNFQNAYVYTFPGVGHGSMVAPPGTPAATCVEAIALDFLADPNQTPESSCLTEVTPRFEYE